MEVNIEKIKSIYLGNKEVNNLYKGNNHIYGYIDFYMTDNSKYRFYKYEIDEYYNLHYKDSDSWNDSINDYRLKGSLFIGYKNVINSMFKNRLGDELINVKNIIDSGIFNKTREGCFTSLPNLEVITLNNVINIGGRSFYNLNNLKEIYLPSISIANHGKTYGFVSGYGIFSDSGVVIHYKDGDYVY